MIQFHGGREMVTATVINCKRLSIRKHPWVTPYAEDVIGTVKAGDTLQVDTDDKVYSWDDKEFYKVDFGSNSGYAIKDCLDF